MTPMLVGRFSSLGRFISVFDGEAGGDVLSASDLSDFVGDAGGLGRTARTLLTQLSREGKRKPPGGEGGSGVAGFTGALANVVRGGDDITACGLVFIEILLTRGGRGGTGGMDDGTAGRGPVGGGRASGGGVIDRDMARLRVRGETTKGSAYSRFEGEMPGEIAEKRALGGVEECTRCREASESDGLVVGDVGDEARAIEDLRDDVEHTETEHSVSDGACGVAPTAGRNARISTFRDGTTSDKCCGRPFCASTGSSWMGKVVRGPNVSARGVGSSSTLSRSLLPTDCEASVPSKDVRTRLP